MKIKLACVQCTELGVCFTHFGCVNDLVECVTTILKVGKGLENSRKASASVELMFHEHFCDLFVPRSYRFFFDMSVCDVAEYLRIELDNVTIE